MAKKITVMQPIPTKTSKWTVTFKKRKASLFKKASELSKLCGVETCVVLYEGPDDPTPDTWPPPEEVMPILSCFKHVREAERAKRMLTRDGFLLQQVQKMQLQLQKIERENRELETASFLNDVLSGQSTIADMATMEMMADLSAMVQKRVGEVNQRISELVSVTTAPHHHLTPDKWTPSAALSPGWCKEVVTDFGLFCATAPPLMTSDNWALAGVSPDLLCGSAAAMVPIPDWCKEGETFGILESTSADVPAPLLNLCMFEDEKDQRCGPTGDDASLTLVVGAEVDDDMERFLDGLIEGCEYDEGTERFWDGSMEKGDEEMESFFNNLIHNSDFESDEIIETLLNVSV